MQLVVQPEHLDDGQRIGHAGRFQQDVIEMVAALLEQLFNRLHADIPDGSG